MCLIGGRIVKSCCVWFVLCLSHSGIALTILRKLFQHKHMHIYNSTLFLSLKENKAKNRSLFLMWSFHNVIVIVVNDNYCPKAMTTIGTTTNEHLDRQ